jgi:hypothetical protein
MYLVVYIVLLTSVVPFSNQFLANLPHIIGPAQTQLKFQRSSIILVNINYINRNNFISYST